jgi:hypothetical protein
MDGDAQSVEAERRAALRQAIATREAARTVARAANDAHNRAVANLELARAAVSQYENLDAEIEQHTVDALRNGETAALPDALAEQVNERQRAVIDLDSADRAVGVFRGELTAAIDHAEQCDTVVKAALHALTDIERDRLRAEGRRLKASGEAHVQVANWSDDSSTWRPICDALLADPEHAPITIADVPAEPIPVQSPPLFVFTPPKDEIIDAGTGETMSMAEYGRRSLLELRPKLDPAQEALATEAAIRASRRLAG